jgi:diaminohydroxyphosphoribosylaminopyrimidine deaminase/5-amino-6-(5-phosphoribosylamino)uracil reductase
MIFSPDDTKYMRRALALARAGAGHVSPNPMVGAVITAPDGRIIGEGWHRRFGGPHAEVNAVRSVADADRALFPQSTIYVTLEPCSHYGKTPPCAKLLVECGFRRVVVAAGDPNPQVAGRGIAMLRQAGIEVDEGLLADESRSLNAAFHTAHILHRPFITLKWAMSADGFMDCDRAADGRPAKFSTPLTQTLVHARRAVHDAIAVGARTALADNPRLDTRLFAGPSPRPVVFDHRGIASEAPLLADPRRTIYISQSTPLEETLRSLYREEGITSLLVEGGASLLNSFIQSGLWDEAYVEVSPHPLASSGRIPAPAIGAIPCKVEKFGSNTVSTYRSEACAARFGKR